MQPAARMQTITPYFFAELGAKIQEMRALGKDIIRLDMGSPDMPPASFIIEALRSSAALDSIHGYAPCGGTKDYREAIAAYYGRRFGVVLDPATEVVGLIGSKEGLFHLSMAFLEAGDVTLVPDPAYPTYATAGRFAGAEITTMPLLADNDFLPDLEAIPRETLRRTKLLWVNYPNNPTGACAPLAFFESLVRLAREHRLLICHDMPYAEITYDGYQAPSLLEIPGAKEVVIEFNSLSKTYNMAGWRLGMACGNAEAVSILNTLKTNIDSGQFRAMQDAGITAIAGNQSWLENRNSVYQERRDIVLAMLSEIGLTAFKPLAAIYVWARVPPGGTSSRFANAMLEEIGVSVTPGSLYGAHGEGYFRISLGTPTSLVRTAMDRIAAWI